MRIYIRENYDALKFWWFAARGRHAVPYLTSPVFDNRAERDKAADATAKKLGLAVAR